MVNGLFITIEGPDGAGKTSVINELYPRLQLIAKRGIVKTREPGGVKISEKIRQIILDPQNEEMDERTEALLYAAARRQHLVQVILPALSAGKIVICDRFVDSSLVLGCGFRYRFETDRKCALRSSSGSLGNGKSGISSTGSPRLLEIGGRRTDSDS